MRSISSLGRDLHEGFFHSDENVLYLHGDVDYVGVCICQNLSNCILRTCMSQYIIYTSIKYLKNGLNKRKGKWLNICAHVYAHTHTYWTFPGSSVVKNLPDNAGDTGDLGLTPGSVRRYPGEGDSNPLQYSCLENPMDRGA